MNESLDIAPPHAATGSAGKVAAASLVFWILKIITTTVGDIGGDVLSISLGLGYALSLLIAVVAFAGGTLAQLRSQSHRPLLYWALILLSSTVGAELSDTIDRGLHLGYVAGAAILLACLVITLGVWHRRGRVLPTGPTLEPDAERLYWLAVLFANSLGSVLGDLFGDRLGFGLAGSIALNAGVLAALWLLHRFTRCSKGALFWTAFVFSRA